LNSALLCRGGECSATVDIFALDTLDGSATFIKSGAAPSFVKRDSSIFRIKSTTAPIGLMKSIDSERIRVEIKGGDYVIMLSDGVSEIAEESTWLLELLTKPPKDTPKAYAEHILAEAKKHSKSRDDMSVIVVKIIKLK
jgi:stage II sporulation protein E